MKKTILGLFILLIALLGVYLYIQSNWPQVTTYRVQAPGEGLEGFRILQLSDLHSKRFGKGNARLLREIQRAAPDLILMTGDMINATGDNGSVVIELIRGLEGRYPVYYSLGNHEQLVKQYAGETGSGKFKEYIRRLQELDVILLDNTRAELPGGIELFGFTLPLSFYTGHKVKNFFQEAELDEGLLDDLLGKPDPGALTILMAHAPKFFEDYRDWGADLVFSGHVHGGLIRIPGLGGLMAPQQGFFPDYSGGAYQEEGKTMIVSRGKGSHLLNLRINNRPQVVLVILEDRR